MTEVLDQPLRLPEGLVRGSVFKNRLTGLDGYRMSTIILLLATTLAAIALGIWWAVNHAKNIEKMGWLFFNQYVLLGDLRSRNGYRLVYCVLSDQAKAKFRRMIFWKQIGAQTLEQGGAGFAELSNIPTEELANIAGEVISRIADCHAYAVERSNVPSSHIPTIKALFEEEDAELVKAVNKANIAFAQNLYPALEISDYHEFAADHNHTL